MFDLLPLGADRNPRAHFFFFFLYLVNFPKAKHRQGKKKKTKSIVVFFSFFFSFSAPSNFELVCSRKYNYPGWSENTAGLNIAMGIWVSSGLLHFIFLYQQILPQDIQTNEVSEGFFFEVPYHDWFYYHFEKLFCILRYKNYVKQLFFLNRVSTSRCTHTHTSLVGLGTIIQSLTQLTP